MEEQNKHIDDLYREELGGYHEAPRDIVWDRIETNLDKIAAGNKRSNFFNRRFLFIGLGIVALLSIAYLINVNKAKQSATIIAKTQINAKHSDISSKVSKIATVTSNPNMAGVERTNKLDTTLTAIPETIDAAQTRQIEPALAQSNKATTNAHAIVDSAIGNSKNDNTNTSHGNSSTALTNDNTAMSNSNSKDNRGKIKTPAISVIPGTTTSALTTTSRPLFIANSEQKNNPTAPDILQKQTAGNEIASDAVAITKSKSTLGSPSDAISTNEPHAVLNSDKKTGSQLPAFTQKKEEIVANNSTKNNSTPSVNGAAREVPASAEKTTNENQPFLPPANAATKRKIDIQLGSKIGFEMGFGNYAADKITGSAYASINLSDKLSLIVQPGIKIARLNQTIDYGNKPYIANSAKNYNDTLEAKGVTPAQDLYYFHYYQSYDSIGVQRKTTTSYIGFETPILFKYAVSKRVSLIAGVNLDMSKIITVNETVTSSQHYETTPSQRTDLQTQSEFMAQLDTVHFIHPSPYYTVLQRANNSPVRLGYIFGIDYNIKQRIFLELMMSQNISSQTYIPDNNVRNLYTQPYFRLSVGYKLGNIFDKKQQTNTTK